MKPCCNPMGRPHSKRKGGKTQRLPPEQIVWYRRIYPDFDWSGDKYLCPQCLFDLRKKIEMLRTVSVVSKAANLARKSTAKKATQKPSTSQSQSSSWMEFPDVAAAYLPSAPVFPIEPTPHADPTPEASSGESDIAENVNVPSDVARMTTEMETSSKETSPQGSRPASPQSYTLRGPASSTYMGSLPTSFVESIPAASSSSGSSLRTSSPSVAPSPLASTLVRLEAEEGLNTTLDSLAVTPIHQHGHSSKQLVKEAYGKAKVSLRGKFDLFTKKMFEVSPTSKQKTCFFCTDLLQEFSIKFPLLTSKLDKYKLLTSIPKRFTIADVQQKIPVTSYMMKQVNKLRRTEGAFSFPTFRYGHPLSADVTELVKNWYLSSDNSRISPGIGDTIYIRDLDGKKHSVQKQRILSNLSELYTAFTRTHVDVQISESKFAALRPKQCVWPGRRGFHNTCVCEIHQNFDFMLKVLGTDLNINSFLEKTVCAPATSECFSGMCSECPKMDYIRGLYTNIADEDEVEFMQWQHTDATDIKKVVLSIDDFMEEFESNVPKILEHDYVYRMQRDFIKHLREDALRDNKGITVHVDFAQNYTFLIQDAVQGFHWSNRQATVHPFVVHWWCGTTNRLAFRTYCVISNELTHDADTFHAFRCEVVNQIKEDFDFLDLQKIYYVSDGAGGQYKNYKNFANLLLHKEDFGIAAEWHFTATAHGKSTCDAISGVVKSVTRIESLKPGKFITTAEEMSDFCTRKLESDTLQILYIDKKCVDRQRAALGPRYNRFNTIPGSRKYHMFAPDHNVMEMRLTSSSVSVTKYNFVLGETTQFSFDTIQIGTFYAFQFSANYHVGMVSDFVQTEGEVLMQVLKINRKTGKMEYPNPFLFFEVPLRDIFMQVSDPATNDGQIFFFVENELEAVKASYKTFCANKKRGGR